MGLEMKIFLAAIVLTTIVYVIRYVVHKVFDAGADAISNAYKRSKNDKDSNVVENLSDYYEKK